MKHWKLLQPAYCKKHKKALRNWQNDFIEQGTDPNTPQQMIQETGGSNGIRDEGLLDSALSAPFQSFGGMELYPSMIGKEARLCYGLIKNHAFLTEINASVFYAMFGILELNGWK